MGEHTMYGRCAGCQQWVPRDEMLSIHTNIYDAANRKEVIRQRYCPTCAGTETGRLKEREWDHVVVEESCLARMPDGSFPPDSVVRERAQRLREKRRASPAVVIEEVARDDGGPLTCRICGHAIDRAHETPHFIESPYADCQQCYEDVQREIEAGR